MEAEAVNAPPRGLENFILCLIPPAARESVAGDLWEMYRAPGQYAFDALKVIPFILASQIRRTANFPVLGLQGVLLFSCFGGFATPDSWWFAAAATASILAGFVLLDVYQGSGRPSPRRAMVEAVLAAGGAAELFGLTAAHVLQPGWQTMPYFAFFGPLMIPLLCLMRTSIILWSDRASGARALPADIADYAAFARAAARRNRIEIAALVGIALVLACLPGQAGAPLVIVTYLLAALYLLADGEARALPPTEPRTGPQTGYQAGFAAAAAQFQRELARQHRIRSLVWWLWFVPLFREIYLALVTRGLAAAQPLSILSGIAAALLFGFFIDSLNRERRGRVQEEIGSLAGLVERPV